MRTPHNLKRRRFIQLVAGIAAFFRVKNAACQSPRYSEEALETSARKFTGFFNDQKNANFIGSLVLNTDYQEQNITSMMQSLCGDQPIDHEQILLSRQIALNRRLEKQQRTDFALGRTRIVKGWILSETEVRLCVLSELICRQEALETANRIA